MPATPNNFTDKLCTITEMSKETPDVVLFRFESQDKIKMGFDPGMFVMIAYVDPATKEKTARAFSIASAPSQDFLEFYISMVHGKLTSKLENAKIGDSYYITGPYGQFKFSPSADKKVLFLAGGTGLAPFMSMLREMKLLSSGNDVSMIYSVKYPNEIIRKSELAELGSQINLKTHITVTRPQPGDGWTGQTGHIDSEMIKRYAPDFAERMTYICGPLNFAQAMKDALMALGVPSERIKSDVWG
jgi:glycine betaine catabolism B